MVRRVPLDDRGRPIGSRPETEPEPDCACPRLDPEEWHEVESDWSGAKFLRGRVWSAFGVPLTYHRAWRGLEERARRHGLPVAEEPMVLLGPGRLARTLLLELADDAPVTPAVWQPGGFAFSRLVPAPLGAMKRELAATVEEARKRYGRPPDAVWIWYLTCASCSRARNFETLFLAHYRDGPGTSGS